MKKRGHHEGSIYQRADKRWVGAVTIPGTRQRKTVYGKSRSEVKEKLAELQALKYQGRLTGQPTQRLDEFLPAWLESVRESLRPRTAEVYALNVRRLTRYLGRIMLNLLKPVEIQQCYRDLAMEGLSANTIPRAHVVLHAALDKAVQWDYIARNPVDAVDAPRRLRTEMQFLNSLQLTALF